MDISQALTLGSSRVTQPGIVLPTVGSGVAVAGASVVVGADTFDAFDTFAEAFTEAFDEIFADTFLASAASFPGESVKFEEGACSAKLV